VPSADPVSTRHADPLAVQGRLARVLETDDDERAHEDAVRLRHQRSLTAFVLRARRVEEHSLARDARRLLQVAKVTFDVDYDVDAGSAVLVQDLPDEEQVESAAARVRPLLLREEDVLHGKVFSALGYFLRGHGNPRLRQEFEGLRGEWRRFDPRGRDLSAYSVGVAPVDPVTQGPGQATRLSDNVLAFAWIYGDVVHADAARLEETDIVGVRERYRAAAPLVCRLMISTVGTLNFVRALTSVGVLPIPQEVFEAAVVVDDPVFRERAEVYVAATDSPDVPPVPGGPLGPEWRRLGPAEQAGS
jgi:hypothetical protein